MTAINLKRGHPNPSLLAVAEMQSLLQSMCREMSQQPTRNDAVKPSFLETGLQYGYEPGNPSFLRELSSFLDRQCVNDDLGEGLASTATQECSSNRLFATMGVSHGVDMICATQTEPGDVVMVERPTYFLVRGIFDSHRLQTRGLPMSSSGRVDVDRLVRDWDRGIQTPPRLIYLIPTHGNPTASTMPIQDRIVLAQAALRHDVLVVADEVYHLLDWRRVETDGPRPARMAVVSERLRRCSGDEESSCSGDSSSLNRVGGCVSLSSFTKIFGPGIRCGWIEGPPEIVHGLVYCGLIQSQGGCGPWVGEILRLALERHVTDQVIERLQRQCQARAETVCSVLSGEPRIRLAHRPIGGYFCWIKFPDSVKTADLQAFCAGKVRFLSGRRCDVVNNEDGGKNQDEDNLSFESHARLCFADVDDDDLEEGVKRLVSCLQEYMLSLETDKGCS